MEIESNPSFSLSSFTLPHSHVQQKACGKAILVGEHAVVHGAPAIAIPLGDSIGVTVKLRRTTAPVENNQLRVQLNCCEPLTRTQKQAVEQVFNRAWALVVGTKRTIPVELTIENNILLGAGLGSSAALSVAMIGALQKFMGLSLSDYEVIAAANELEKFFHGQPSGIDVSVIYTQKPIVFERKIGGAGLTPFFQVVKISECEGARWPFTIIDTEERSLTARMVAHAATKFDKTSCALLAQFEHITNGSLQALSSGNWQLLGRLLNENQCLLEDIGVSTSRIKSFINWLDEIGVVGAKLTGAGGGGCVLALLNPLNRQEQANKIKIRCQKLGVWHHLFEL